MNQVKQEVIEEGLSDEGEITDTINSAAKKAGVDLTDEQIAQIVSLMQNIAQYDYDVKALKETLDNLGGKEEGFFSKLVSTFTGFFGGGDDKGGIINSTNDNILGDNAVVDSTLDEMKDKMNSDKEDGFFDKVANFFKGIFGGNETEDASEDETAPESESDESAPEDSIAPQSEDTPETLDNNSDDPEAPISADDDDPLQNGHDGDADDDDPLQNGHDGDADDDDNSDNTDTADNGTDDIAE